MRHLIGLAVLTAFASAGSQAPGTPASNAQCAPDNAGLKLPAGFCATLFADSLFAPRHLFVAPNGDVIAAIRRTQASPGGVVILRDANGDGRADQRGQLSGFGATDVWLVGDSLYTESGDAILRYRLPTGALTPSGGPDTIVSGLPIGGHAAKTFVVRDGYLYVNQGSATNSCQERDRQNESKGLDPCPELDRRAGIWRYRMNRSGQTIADGERFATGIRNAVAIAVEPRSRDLYVVQHGRDQLSQNWPALYTHQKNAETPAEELFRVTQGSDFGWPYCFYDPELKKKILAPEYGGDGKTVGRCADKKGNVGVFPGHWAPNDLLFYTGSSLPARYRNGAFIAFHGSWNRAPEPQAGYKVVFQPMSQGRAVGDFEVFVDGFIRADGQQTELGGRPMALAQGRDGELYLSDDGRGRIWKIMYRGGN